MPEDSGRWLIGKGKLHFFTTALVQLFQTRCKISLATIYRRIGWVRGGGGLQDFGRSHDLWGKEGVSRRILLTFGKKTLLTVIQRTRLN